MRGKLGSKSNRKLRSTFLLTMNRRRIKVDAFVAQFRDAPASSCREKRIFHLRARSTSGNKQTARVGKGMGVEGGRRNQIHPIARDTVNIICYCGTRETFEFQEYLITSRGTTITRIIYM